MGFLISLDLWYSLIFVCRIHCFIPFCSARPKFSFFIRIQWLIPFCSFFVFVQYPVIYTKLLCSTKDFVFLQNQVICTNLLIWTKAFLFLRDPVIYTIQLCGIKAFLFLQDPVTNLFFFSWQVPFVHSFLFSFFACSSFWLWDLCFTITFCLPAFDKLVEQHINLIQYSISLLWNCFLQYPVMTE